MSIVATGPLTRTTPSEADVDARGVVAFVDEIEASPDLELHSLMLLRHGQVFAEAWWAPYGRDDAPLLYSLSKSFTSTALGFAVAEGLLALSDRVVDRLTPTGPVSDRTSRITVRDLVAMATGHREDALARAVAADPDDLAQGFLTVDPDAEPGSVFAYNNAATYTLGAVVQQAVGSTLIDYLTPRLFAPLEISPGSWDQRPPGRDVAFTGLHLPTEAIARFGQLYLDGGVWQGAQVLPAGWAETALAVHTPNPDEPNPDWQQGYGFQFWRGRHGSVRGDGAFGQFCVLLPEQDAVVVTTSGTENMQGILDAVWAHLLPAYDRAVDPGADDALADRLRGLAVNTGRRDPTVEHASQTIRVAAVEPEPSGWTLTLTDPEGTYVVPVGREDWIRTDVTAGAGRGLVVAARGREEDGVLTAEVVLIESPHRLRVTSGPGGSEVVWHTAPLVADTLATLATPRR